MIARNRKEVRNVRVRNKQTTAIARWNISFINCNIIFEIRS